MHKPDNATSVAVEPTRGAVGVKPNAFFQDLATGGTIVQADFMNAVMKELSFIVTQAGLTLDKADDTQLGQAIKLIDQQTVTLTGGTVALSQSQNTTGTTTHTFSLADFTSGSTLDTDEIRMLHVEAYAEGEENDYGRVEALLPDGVTWVDLNNASGGAGSNNERNAHRVLCSLPINKNQSTATIKLTSVASMDSAFRIVAATQRTFS
jgi:hypothetical protein